MGSEHLSKVINFDNWWKETDNNEEWKNEGQGQESLKHLREKKRLI